MFTVTKKYRDLPAAHRQPLHKGHCRLIHGHNWGFDITFGCESLDLCGFVVDVGGLKPLKEQLEMMFDHTLLLNVGDPWVEKCDVATVVVVPNCGMEGLAEFVFNMTSLFLLDCFKEEVAGRGLRVVSVTCWEDSKNSATYKL